MSNRAIKDIGEPVKMMKFSVAALSLLLTTALSAPLKVKEETHTLFHGGDFHIMLHSLGEEVTFVSSSVPTLTGVVLMRGGKVIYPRAKLNLYLSHLIVDNVGEGDEGLYTVKNPETPEDVRRITLIVRDCSNEENVKYGDNYHIQSLGVTYPITLEYRPLAVEANLTSNPAQVLLTSTGVTRDGYQGRISVNDRSVILSAVTGADEGSYTLRDAEFTIKKKICLNVKENQNFVRLPHGGSLKINLILNSTLVHLYYSSDYDSKRHLIMDKGELTSAQSELGMEGRLSVEGSLVILESFKGADAGHYRVTDLLNFPVSSIYVKLEPYRLPSVLVAVIALCGLLVLLLLVCLLSCLIKVKKRANRAAALEKIAQKAGKEDEGDAFRQVVKNITQLNEDSKHSQADNTEKSQSTEVDIKGLEVSSKEVGMGNLESSDSGVGFNTTALPLDTDTDAPDQVPDSEAASLSIAPETKSAPPPPAAEIKLTPVAEIKPSPVMESKPSLAPETMKTPDLPSEPKLEVPKPADVKLSPVQTPEPMPGLSPVPKPSPSDDAKTPEPKPAPSPEPKPSTPQAHQTSIPPAESKPALTTSPEPPKSNTTEPILMTNGTPEPAPASKHSPEPAPKAASAKTPEIELNSASPALEAKVEALAEESSTATST